MSQYIGTLVNDDAKVFVYFLNRRARLHHPVILSDTLSNRGMSHEQSVFDLIVAKLLRTVQK